MDILLIISVLVVLIALGAPIAVALGLAGISGLLISGGSGVLYTAALGLWNSLNNFALAAVPLFIFMAEIMQRTRAMDIAFRSIDTWAILMPGRLLHTNIIGSTVFAACCGSSVASCVTVSRLTLPILEKDGYVRHLVLSTLAGPTTLGILIPPSIPFIIYGLMAEESISRLFMAGIFPGLLISSFFILYVVTWSLRLGSVCKLEGKYTWGERLIGIPKILPLFFIIIFIMGAIYTGWATPTEAAAWAVLGSLIVAFSFRGFSFTSLKDAGHAAMRTSVMILFIVAGATLLNMALARTNIAEQILALITWLQLSKYGVIAIFVVFYMILGCLMEGLAIMLLTLPILLPIVHDFGINVIWFGVFMVILIEIGQFTPPVGMNLFVLRGVTGESLFTIAKAAAPMVVLMLLAILLITIFPQIALWLPSTMG